MGERKGNVRRLKGRRRMMEKIHRDRGNKRTETETETERDIREEVGIGWTGRWMATGKKEKRKEQRENAED